MKPAILRCVTIALPLAFAALACGQVTGLSDDYQFDLEGGSSGDGGGDGPKSDAPPGDGASEAAVCGPQAIASAMEKMSSTNASTACKTCLAAACCNDVETCARATDCNTVFRCKLDCTEKLDQRAQCLSRCTNVGGGVPGSYTTGIGACGGRSCKAECGFP